MSIYFIDFESSSLSWNSYPIEVAWGKSIIDIQSYLISPREVEEWDDWNTESEKLHMLSREQIESVGEHPNIVCDALSKELTGKTVYSDNPNWDCMWLTKLFFVCNLPIPSIDFRHIDSLLIEIISPNPDDRVEGLYKALKLKAQARKMVVGRHRATLDVEYLIRLYELAKRLTITSS